MYESLKTTVRAYSRFWIANRDIVVFAQRNWARTRINYTSQAANGDWLIGPHNFISFVLNSAVRHDRGVLRINRIFTGGCNMLEAVHPNKRILINVSKIGRTPSQHCAALWGIRLLQHFWLLTIG